jgi:hypothetical protein
MRAVAAAYRVDGRRVDGPDRGTLPSAGTAAAVRDFVSGLLAPLPSKNCWTIAEHAVDDNPGGMQDLIGRASSGRRAGAR